VFPGEIPVLHLPLDYPRPPVQSFAGSVLEFEIPPSRTKALNALALKEGSTLYMLLLAVLNILLSKLSSQEDIVVGTPAAGRRHTDLEKIIGMFVNTLALRNHSYGGQTFRDFLQQIKEKTLEAFENQEYQFEELVDKAAVNRDASRNPLFDVMFALDHIQVEPGDSSRSPQEREAPTTQHDEYEAGISKFDLTVSGLLGSDKLFMTFQYCTRLFKPETIQRFIGYFKSIIDIILETPSIHLRQIDILPGEEKKQMLYDLTGTAREYPKDKTIQQMFQEQAVKSPDNAALIGPGLKRNLKHVFANNMQYISYKELNRKSNQVALLLRRQGVKSDTVVSIMINRSIEMIIGLLGILKAGGAYLPIDFQYPPERIRMMLSDSNSRVLLTQTGLSNIDTIDTTGEPGKFAGEVIAIDDEGIYKEEREGTNLALSAMPKDTAYIIFTSGSTGKPRGVMIRHFSVINLAIHQIKRFRIDKQDRVLQFSSISFDASVEQIFIALFSGAGLVLIERDHLLDMKEFEAFLSRYSITHIDVVPSFLGTLNLHEPNQLKRVISGGEVCPPALAEKWSKICEFYNEYGPTETTVTSIVHLVEHPDESQVHLPIGKPLANTNAYVLDYWGLPVPCGVRGELYIGGDGLSRGYLNHPELTAEKFIEQVTGAGDRCNWTPRQGEPINRKFLRGGSRCFTGAVFSKSAPPGRQRQKIYKTGDLVRWQPDGNIQFLGRIDYQVKIRGYRIEPGEIEKQLLKHKQIKEAIVITREDSTREKYLCAYIVSPKEVDIPGLRHTLSEILPEYMIPAHFVPIERIPLTSSGKTDKKALPVPYIEKTKEDAAPRNNIEKKLVEIWSEVLGIKKDTIGIDRNFFHMGGHSQYQAIGTIYRNRRKGSHLRPGS
jgi:amino acid adenylation domain-containing protein